MDITESVAAEGTSALPQSIAALMQSELDTARRSRKPMDVEMVGYGPRVKLHCLFRPVDNWSEMTKQIKAKVANKGYVGDDYEAAVAIQSLLLGSCGSYVIHEGEQTDLGLKLGLDLLRFIKQPTPEHLATGFARDDFEAVPALFFNDVVMRLCFAELNQWWTNGSISDEEEVLGN